MSTDLRALMQDLADSVPYTGDDIALADRSYTTGRRRRRVRHVEATSAAAVVALMALFAGLFLGSAPLAARYGSSSGTTVNGYPREIGQQFPILDLPAKPGPIAGLIADRTGWWAFSATGHRWRVPGIGNDGTTPAVSPDGRLIAYLSGHTGPYQIHDLVSGTVVTVPGVGTQEARVRARFAPGEQTQELFSADDRYLAFTGSEGLAEATIVIDVRTGRVLASLHADAFAAGWSGDRLVTVASGGGRILTTYSMPTGSKGQITLRPLQALPGGGQNGAVVSADGQRIAYLPTIEFEQPDQLQTLTQLDLVTGDQLGPPATVPPTGLVTQAAVGRRVAYLHQDSGAGSYTVVAVDAAGKAQSVTSIAMGRTPYWLVLAADAFDGRPHAAMTLDRISAWVVAWQVWLYWIVGISAAGSLITWRVRVAGRRYAEDHPERVAMRAAWSKRRKAWTFGSLLAAACVALGLLIPYVVIPLNTGDLRVTGPALWWSPIDQAAATQGGAYGAPASTTPFRDNQRQGFVVLVHNPTGLTQRIVEPSAQVGEFSVDVATTAGTQPRSLGYTNAAAIPAHGSRWVRLLLRDDICWEKGGSTSIASVDLQVDIGLISRAEQLPLPEQMQLLATTDIRPTGSTC